MLIITSVLLIAVWNPINGRDTGNLGFIKEFISKSRPKAGGRRQLSGSRAAEDHPEYPYVVSLQLKDHPMLRFCSGSLLSHTWVLTATHCNGLPFVVRYADFTLLPNETKATVKVIRTFDGSSPRTMYGIVNDILLVLTEKVPKMAFGKISMVDYKSIVQRPVKYAEYSSTIKEKNLRELDVEEIFGPLKVGQSVTVPCELPEIFGLFICIASKRSVRQNYIELGGEGGPLLYNGEIVGVLTGTQDDMPYYAAVRPEWIDELMNNPEFKSQR